MNRINNKNDDAHMLDYLVILAKYSRMIIGMSIAATVITYLILFILPNKYTSTARLLPPQQNVTMIAQLLNNLGGGGTPGAPMAGPIAGSIAGLLGMRSPSDVYVSMMVGNTIYDRVIERFNLRKLYKEKIIENARKVLSKRALIGVDKKTGLIIIEVTDKDPKRAVEIANAFFEELDNLLRSLAIQEAKGRLTFLEKERDQTSQKLAKMENALRAFSEQNSVIQIDTQTRGTLEYIARLRAEIDAKEVQIQVVRQQATSYNYDVVRLETEVRGLRHKLLTAEKQYDQSRVGDVCLTTSKTPSLMLEYLRLFREVKFQEGVYQLYTKMVELARLDMVRDFAIVQVVDHAKPPEKRSNKRLPPALLAGMATCFVLIFYVFMRELWNQLNQSQENSQRLALLNQYLNPWREYARRFISTFKRN